MTEPATTVSKPGSMNGAAIQEYRLCVDITLQDVDQEVSLTLASLACAFDRREVGSTVTYMVRHGSLELGRLVIAPPSRIFPTVRVREVHLSPPFEALCRHVRCDLEALSWAAEQVGVRESTRFSYSRLRRRQIVTEYRAALRNGEVDNKGTWAARYHISRKTLWRYECEFPETDPP
jgi:hypothetical protein